MMITEKAGCLRSLETVLKVLNEPVGEAAVPVTFLFESGMTSESIGCEVHIHLPCLAVSDKGPEIGYGE